MSNAKQLHHSAMRSLRQAEEISASLKPDMALYKQNLRDALEMETKAAMLLKDKISAEPTRSILFRSAASIAINCGEYRKAENLVVQALYGNPPQEIKDELLDLFSNAYIEPNILPAGRGLVKRVFDIISSVLVIFLICSWVFPLVALLIKMDSPGPVFFKQLRTGSGNKPFYCYMFRTVKISRESNIEKAVLTQVGHLLKITSLRELPQFFNVLKGDMTIVGPVPMAASYNTIYSTASEIIRAKYVAKPGLTGLVQVSDGENEYKSYERYVEKWSLYLDIKIITASFVKVIRSYRRLYSLISSNIGS